MPSPVEAEPLWPVRATDDLDIVGFDQIVQPWQLSDNLSIVTNQPFPRELAMLSFDQGMFKRSSNLALKVKKLGRHEARPNYSDLCAREHVYRTKSV